MWQTFVYEKKVRQKKNPDASKNDYFEFQEKSLFLRPKHIFYLASSKDLYFSAKRDLKELPLESIKI